MDKASELIMSQGGTSDLDRAKRVINKQQAQIERLRSLLETAADAFSRGGSEHGMLRGYVSYEWYKQANKLLDRSERDSVSDP